MFASLSSSDPCRINLVICHVDVIWTWPNPKPSALGTTVSISARRPSSTFLNQITSRDHPLRAGIPLWIEKQENVEHISHAVFLLSKALSTCPELVSMSGALH
eukprot:s719_g12.t1